MQSYIVTEILSKPEQMELKLDCVTIVYWGVKVEMLGMSDTIQSIVTFSKLSKAKKLKLGDAFER
jgi:hypothetical protein